MIRCKATNALPYQPTAVTTAATATATEAAFSTEASETALPEAVNSIITGIGVGGTAKSCSYMMLPSQPHLKMNIDPALTTSYLQWPDRLYISVGAERLKCVKQSRPKSDGAAN